MHRQPSRLAASVQAVLVVFVWATSWIFVKRHLDDTPALSFAGLRYGLAFVCLLALLVGRPALRSSVLALPRRAWLRLRCARAAAVFGPIALPASQPVAVGVVAVGVVAFAAAAMLGGR